MDGNKVLVGLSVTLAAGMPAMLMAVESATLRAILTLLAVVTIYVLGVYTPTPKDAEKKTESRSPEPEGEEKKDDAAP